MRAVRYESCPRSWYKADELGIYHNPSRSLGVASASRPERYRQGKAEREPAVTGGFVSPDQGRRAPPADPAGGEAPRLPSVSIRTVAVRIGGDKVPVDAEE